jgi:hypothetical protein
MNVINPMTEAAISQALNDMELDDMLNTQSSHLKAQTAQAKLLSFQEWHLRYLLEHPKINAVNYLTNLRVMIKVRP